MVKIKNLQRKVKVNTSVLKKIAARILEIEGLSETELSLVLVNDRRIEEINRRYRHQDGPTDVIAFRMADGLYAELNTYLLGDIVISVETALSQAAKFRRTAAEELCLYLIHGILHLEGYDDQQPEERKRMWRRQRRIMDKMLSEEIQRLLPERK